MEVDVDELRLLLTLVANDQASGVIVADAAMHCLYRPYDGGADVITPSMTDRFRMRRKYRDWL